MPGLGSAVVATAWIAPKSVRVSPDNVRRPTQSAPDFIHPNRFTFIGVTPPKRE